jgi:excisionase family DNA binding protein
MPYMLLLNGQTWLSAWPTWRCSPARSREATMSKTRPSDVPMPSPEEIVLTRLEVCRVARITTSTFDRAVSAKRLHVHRIGRKVVVERKELNRFIGLDEGA